MLPKLLKTNCPEECTSVHGVNIGVGDFNVCFGPWLTPMKLMECFPANISMRALSNPKLDMRSYKGWVVKLQNPMEACWLTRICFKGIGNID